MKYFWNITFITSIASSLGFLIIFMGIINYISVNKSYERIKKNE